MGTPGATVLDDFEVRKVQGSQMFYAQGTSVARHSKDARGDKITASKGLCVSDTFEPVLIYSDILIRTYVASSIVRIVQIRTNLPRGRAANKNPPKDEQLGPLFFHLFFISV